MGRKKIKYEDLSRVEWIVYKTSVANIRGEWTRRGESVDGKYFYEDDYNTGDHRIVDAETGEQLWGYYSDFYTG